MTEQNKTTTIKVTKETLKKIAQAKYSLGLETYEDVILKLFEVSQKIKKANKNG